MEKKDNLLAIALGILAILASLFGAYLFRPQSSFVDIGNKNVGVENEEVKVERVIDGDTIQVRDLKTDKTFRVRYLSIDTPELEGPGYKSCFGEQAKDKNEELVSDKKLILEFDRDKYDRFGRTLAYIYTLDEAGDKETFVNLELVKEGYARFYLDKQNIRYQDELVQASLDAHNDFLGLWGSCGDSRFNNKCVIKGNVDRLGHKYYHLPGDKYYSQTVISPLKEDQWLCTVDEAEAKNFHRALQEK